ncbi:unnamed protein product [Lymnaea stagnalis]|uniref:Protein kinase domain-containing protein n=1 Tax=Lymnaea stagnalis TaxID=6523 RepID=A0AAV2HX65_LYMST
MSSNKFSAQESGPDEDHQIRSFTAAKFSKVVHSDCHTLHWKKQITFVPKEYSKIKEFLNDVPHIISQEGTYGYIWDKSLQPSDGKYEPGVHYCGTREPDRKSVHGVVSFYRDGVTGVKFAIKTLEENTHFHPEEITVSLINEHPNICAVYGIIIRNHRIHILLEHAGLPLNEERSWIADSPQRMLLVAKQSFQAIEALHQSGFVHCDIKPDNIMISKHGNDFTVKLIDFGSCQREGTVLPHHAHTTLFYWSPEIWQALTNKKQVICKFAMDVYALALTLFFVQTSNHLMQMLREKDIKDVMTEKPEDILCIALPETIPTELRAVMRQCLDGCPMTRWSAQQAVRQLAEDTMTQTENYKDKFERIYALLKSGGTKVSSRTVFGEQSTSFPFSVDHQERVQYFVGSSKGIEKRELTTTAKSRKNNLFTGNKCSKSLSKCKKVTKPPTKGKPTRKNSFERNIAHNYHSGLLPEVEKSEKPVLQRSADIMEASPDEKAYSCSILLKNLALQVQPIEPVQEVSVSQTQTQFLSHMETLGKHVNILADTTQTTTGKLVQGTNPCQAASKETVHFSFSQCQKTDLYQNPNQRINAKAGKKFIAQNETRGEIVWKSVTIQNVQREELSKPVDWESCKYEDSMKLNAPYVTEFRASRDGSVMSQTGTSESGSIMRSLPEITDITIHPVVATTQTNPDPSELFNTKVSSGDDMDFVIDALGPTAFTGNEDDIVNNLFSKLIEQDKQNDPCVSTVDFSTDVNLNQFRGEGVCPNPARDIEVMDIDQAEPNLNFTSKTPSLADCVTFRTSRKRMSYSLENAEIPKKTICTYPELRDKEQKLPNFDIILD